MSWDLHPSTAVVSSHNNGGIDVTLMRDQLFGPVSSADHINPNKNTQFRYDSLQRLGNLVTTQSNVYAVWMTIGYFEVAPISVSLGHPDGYELGRELGIDTGEIRRHRAFYIIDRSIPVAFEPGQDHNAEKTIQLQRFIE